MTLDEAIQHCKDVARDNRAKAEEEWRAFSIYPFGNVEESATFVDRCDECAEEHEQLAQWLEELKKYKDLDKVHNVNKIIERFEEIEEIYLKWGSCEEHYGLSEAIAVVKERIEQNNLDKKIEKTDLGMDEEDLRI